MRAKLSCVSEHVFYIYGKIKKEVNNEYWGGLRMAVNSFSDYLGKKGIIGSKVYNNRLIINEEIPKEIAKENVKTIEAIEKRGRYTMVKLEGEAYFANAKNYIILD